MATTIPASALDFTQTLTQTVAGRVAGTVPAFATLPDDPQTVLDNLQLTTEQQTNILANTINTSLTTAIALITQNGEFTSPSMSDAVLFGNTTITGDVTSIVGANVSVESNNLTLTSDTLSLTSDVTSLTGNTLTLTCNTIVLAANTKISANSSTGNTGQYLASGGPSGKPYWATFAVAGTPSFDSVLGVGNVTNKQVAISNNVQIQSLGVGTAATGTAGEIRATNNITAYYSDDGLKTRLGNIENALDKIDQLTGFYYEANEVAQDLGYDKIREVGVSAQDTQRVLPEIVAPAPIDDRYLTVRYEKFAPLLIEGIKELRAEIRKIKTHLNI